MLTSRGDERYDVLADLRRDLLAWLPIPTILVVTYVYVFANHAFGVQPWPILGITATVAACSLAASRIRGRYPLVAGYAYIAGLAVAVLVLALGSSPTLGLMLFPALILLTTAVLGVRPMLAMTTFGVVAALGYAGIHRLYLYSVAGAIFVICLTGFVSWLSHRNLVTAVEWVWNSYRQARSSTEEARQRRAELTKTVKALDEAYGRLERFSAQLAQAREAAEEARRAKQQFVATVSHELRTPLNIIIGFTELMTLSPESYGVRGVPRQFLGDVNRIYRSAQHLKGLIDDVLDLSQVDARQMVLLSERGSLAEVISEATDMVWGLAKQKGLHLAMSVPKDLPSLTFDRLRIRQVLLNLLSNAVRFTETGGITVTARRDRDELEVCVADTGPGIAAEDLDRVFEEFHQLDTSLSRRHEGTGLGLALSRRFVALHGGRMWVESELGHGSRFHLALPLTAPAPQSPVSASRPLPVPPGVQAHPGRTVLIAGADPMIANLLRRHLRGFEVVGVPEEQADVAVEAERPQAIIRAGLPEAASGSVAQRGTVTPPIPVIACPLPDPAYLSRQLGVDHYLVKPLARERLLELLAGYGNAARRILIVDDDAELAELTARTVRAAGPGREVEVACGGEEGWARMREWVPDLVLLDLVMPGLDGLALLQLMRADERLRGTHVAIVTARDLPDEDTRLPGRGAIEVQTPYGLSIGEALNCLQAILDALPGPRPAPSSLPAPAAARPGPPAS